ncbi:conserved hypothetical protein [Beggiatoa sp. PS]|nr:conserved hypothetical protein [Beggiatoa sp. PS]
MKLNQIALITDENISPKVVTGLRHMGINVLDTKEQQWHGTVDEDIMQIAYQEQRFILTHDSDFGTLAINQGIPCYGILYLRLKNLKSVNVIRICEDLFQMEIEIIPQTIWVIEDTRIRIRHLIERE